MSDPPRRSWAPVSASGGRVFLGRLLSMPCYPVVLPYALFSHCEATAANARWWRTMFAAIGLGASAYCHHYVWRRWSESSPFGLKSILGHLAVTLTIEHSHAWLTFIAHQLIEIFEMDRTGNRLNANKLHGPRVLVVGNGPSALEGEPLGDKIDQFDEVVRFNNFQTKVAGMEKFVGTKTTVHYSDGVLYPTYTEYHVPGADVVLSLIMDRFMVAGTYFILRGAADMETGLTMAFLKDKNLSWTSKADIVSLYKRLKLRGLKHPTSGMLAIDHFVRQPGVELPVYIHGFDFFQGPKMHYFDEHEPWYERLNDRIGVNMHSPHKEKVYVEELIKQGKVKFLKDKK
jgi:hypothetical protein